MKSPTMFVLVCALFFACANEKKVLPIEHQALALKLGSNELGKKLQDFTRQDSLDSFFSYQFGLDHLFKEYPDAKSKTPGTSSIFLMRAFNAMNDVLMRDAPVFQDSLDAFHFFLALTQSNLLNFDKELLRDATFEEYIFAYTKFLPENSLNKRLTSKGEMRQHLQIEIKKPSEFNDPTPGQKAFALIRANIVREKFQKTLSEKQKLTMETMPIDFIKSLSEDQAKLFAEFREYSKFLE